MIEFQVSFSGTIRHTSQPCDSDLKTIKNNIAEYTHTVNQGNIKSFVKLVGEDCHPFCPSTFNLRFYDAGPNMKNFKQIQLFPLQFNGGISFETVKSRADKYNLPALFAYRPLGSSGENEFIVVFLNDQPVFIKYINIADIILDALFRIFPEADPRSKDLCEIYFGGRKLLYFDEAAPMITVESVTKSMCIYLKDNHGNPGYKNHVEQFFRDNNIDLNTENPKSFRMLLLEHLPGNHPKSESDVVIPSNTNIPVEHKPIGSPAKNFSFRISLDTHGYTEKPKDSEVGAINSRIGKYSQLCVQHYISYLNMLDGNGLVVQKYHDKFIFAAAPQRYVSK